MKLIVGLGNPGDNFCLTKHNFGFWVIDELVKQRSLKYKAGEGEYIIALDEQCIFAKPTSYVNNSGIAIKQILDHYKITNLLDIIVIYDDIDINVTMLGGGCTEQNACNYDPYASINDSSCEYLTCNENYWEGCK